VNQFYETPQQLYEQVPLWLARGKADRKHPFHQCFLATYHPELGVQNRTLVFRDFDWDKKQIFLHTDVRSAKVMALSRLSQGELLLYSQPHKLQLRFRVHVTVDQGSDFRAERWQRLSKSSRRCYLNLEPPGSPSSEWTPGYPKNYVKRSPTKEESEAGAVNFCVLNLQIQSLDVLYLRGLGHQRAQYTFHDKDLVSSTWVVP
jgi:hypothetical protein